MAALCSVEDMLNPLALKRNVTETDYRADSICLFSTDFLVILLGLWELVPIIVFQISMTTDH